MPGNLAAIEAGLRGGAIALFALTTVIYWRDSRHVAQGRYGALFALCAVAYMIESAPALVTQAPPWLIPVRMLSLCAPAVFQLWAAANFDDAFAPAGWRWLPFGGMAVLGLWAILADRWMPWRVVQGAAFILVGFGIWQVVAGRATDLVETRRRFRLVLALAAGLSIAGLTVLAYFASAEIRMAGSIASAATLVALGLLSALTGLTVNSRRSPVQPAAMPARGRIAAAAGDAEERVLLDRLQRAMETERVYREEAFGIAALAERLRIPEYRLRRLINQRLGHRNFTSFVNTYRLAETIAALSDPGQLQVPVLTIALDAGFQSLGPFNRAFKAETGVTPTEFRRDRAERRAAE